MQMIFRRPYAAIQDTFTASGVTNTLKIAMQTQWSSRERSRNVNGCVFALTPTRGGGRLAFVCMCGGAQSEAAPQTRVLLRRPSRGLPPSRQETGMRSQALWDKTTSAATSSVDGGKAASRLRRRLPRTARGGDSARPLPRRRSHQAMARCTKPERLLH